jgi:hypothetical protein
VRFLQHACLILQRAGGGKLHSMPEFQHFIAFYGKSHTLGFTVQAHPFLI